MPRPTPEEEDPLDELPPLDAENGDERDDDEREPIEYDDVADADPLDDASAVLGDDGLELDALNESAAGLEDDDEREPREDDGADEAGLPDLALGADLEEPGVGEEAFDLDLEETQDAADQGEEGPSEADEELRAEDLPDLDADDDGEVPDAELYDRAAFADVSRVSHVSALPWADDAWETTLVARGSFTSVRVSGPHVLASGPACVVQVDAKRSNEGDATAVVTLDGRRALEVERRREVGAAARLVGRGHTERVLAAGIGVRGESLDVVADESGDLVLETNGGLPRRIPPLPDDHVPTSVASLEGVVALGVDDVGVYVADCLSKEPAPPALLEASRYAAAFAVVPGPVGGARPSVVTLHVETERVVVVAHPAGAPPRVVATIEPEVFAEPNAAGEKPPAAVLEGDAGRLAIAFEPTTESLYIATKFGLFAARLAQRGA